MNAFELALFLIVIGYANAAHSNETSLVDTANARSKRSLYYRNDNQMNRHDQIRRLRLARNPVFGRFGRFADLFGLWGGGFNDYPDYYDSYGDYTNQRRIRPTPRPKPPKPERYSVPARKNSQHVGIKLSSRLNAYPLTPKSNTSLTGINKLSQLLNQINSANSTKSKEEPSVTNTDTVTSTKKSSLNGSDLKKVKTPAHLIQMRFPTIDRLASRIVSSMDSSASTSTPSARRYTMNYSPSALSSSLWSSSLVAPNSYAELASMGVRQPSNRLNQIKLKESAKASALTNLKKLKTPSTSLADKKFPKIEKLASRIVSHFI